MRIQYFRLVVEESARPHKLKDCDVVIDAQNFFYDCYEASQLRVKFGAECDRYAKYLRDYLNMFKNANIKCYFVFKGGTKALDKKIQKIIQTSNKQRSISTVPILASAIHIEVLKELGFDFFFSEFESKIDCMTLARRLSCPVVSDDIEYPLSGVPYISKQSLEFFKDEIRCKLITQATLLRNIKLDKDKLALFILITDESIFPEKSFEKLFQLKCFTNYPRYRNAELIQWLSQTSEGIILRYIFKTTKIEQNLIIKELMKVKNFVRGKVNSEMATNYFFQAHSITDWFLRGVAENRIPKEYIDLYRSKVLFRQTYDEDFIELSLSIIKYAYDLLTDFNNEGFNFIHYNRDTQTEQTTEVTKTIEKPIFLLDEPILQNDWDTIRSLGLFQHFLSEIMYFDCDKLDIVPDDARVLMITLLYISHNLKLQSETTNTKSTTNLAYGVLLSYVMLGVVRERVDNNSSENSVTIFDCESALRCLDDYFHVYDVDKIMNKDLLILVKQFQFCLLQMNYLNKLCGSPFEPTTYSKTYNGTFVYKVIYTMQNEGIVPSVNNILKSAPTVLKCFQNIVDTYDTLIEPDNFERCDDD